MIAPTPHRAIEVFDRVSGEVGRMLDATEDWGPSGLRAGQYAVDLRVDRVVLDGLAATGWAVLSEESGITPGADPDGPVVVVDPLDGSTNASRGVPWYATAMCLVVRGLPTVALVRVHPIGRTYHAVRGQGSWCDGRRLSVRGGTSLSDAVVGVSGLPTHHYGWAQFRALGAAAPDLCAVADGSLDAWCDMSEDAHGVWDYLAALLVCTEAGAVASDVHGRDLVTVDHRERRTPVVASSADLLEAVLVERRRDEAGPAPGRSESPATASPATASPTTATPTTASPGDS